MKENLKIVVLAKQVPDTRPSHTVSLSPRRSASSVTGYPFSPSALHTSTASTALAI